MQKRNSIQKRILKFKINKNIQFHNAPFFQNHSNNDYDITIQFLLMGCKQQLKELFLKCDIFSTSEFLRYNDEPQYRTFTGATCSIVTVVTFCAIFMSVMINTFERTEIIWSLNTIDVPIDQFNVTATIEGKNKFMFAVQISGQDLNNETNKKFDVKFSLRKRLNTQIQSNQQIIPLQKCTPQHWNVNEQILKTFYRMEFNKMLCPPIGQQIPMQGKFTSQFFQYAEIEIFKCSTSPNSSKTCSNQTIPANHTFHYNVYILNTLLNPQSPDYITYYLQDRNFIMFTTEFSSLVSIFISSYEITTDTSITPLKQEFVESGAMINSLGQVIPYQFDGGAYASFVFRRASTTTIVNRGFKRVDQTFSYIGGLFGFVLIVLLFMKEYTEYSFQMDASSHLYYQDPEKPIESHKFNLLIFIGYIIYLLLEVIGIETNWKRMKEVDNCRQEIQKQLDVRFLFERINFLEKATTHLFSQEQTKFLHLQRKLTLKEATELREKYRSKRKIIKNVGDNQIQLTENHFDNTSQIIQPQPQIYFGSKMYSNNLVTNEMNQQNELISQQKNEKTLKDIKDNFKRLHKDGHSNHVSKKIIEDLDPRIVKIINKPHPLDQRESQGNEQSSVQKLQQSMRNTSQQQNRVYQTRLTGANHLQFNRFQQNQEQTGKKQRDIENTFDFIN